jgi:hypothetical protein
VKKRDLLGLGCVWETIKMDVVPIIAVSGNAGLSMVLKWHIAYCTGTRSQSLRTQTCIHRRNTPNVPNRGLGTQERTQFTYLLISVLALNLCRMFLSFRRKYYHLPQSAISLTESCSSQNLRLHEVDVSAFSVTTSDGQRNFTFHGC